MSRNTDYKFVETDSATIEARLIASYEKITGHTLKPAEPDRLFIAWVADAFINERVNQNYVGNQNIPSRAEGENLDALGEWIFSLKRKPAQAAKCTVRFNISSAQATSISIPVGTRVSDVSQNLIWTTTDDALIAIGETCADVMVQCATAGTIGNGYTAGQINTLVDVDNILYFSSCANTTVSDGGAEEQDDEAYYESMRSVLDSYSTAGAVGSYIYWAKSVSDEISDVKAINPKITRTATLTVFEDTDENRCAFLGGDQFVTNTLEVFATGSTTPLVEDTDYTVDYTDGLLKIGITSTGSVATANTIDVSVAQGRAGYVYIYALMDNGTIATETIKAAILTACNATYVRPLTDYVSVEDPEIIDYDITCTYYISEDTQMSVSEIEAAVTSAVNEYVEWQCSKLGRDINPDELQARLKQAGVKRVVITAPTFTRLHSGYDNDVPQIAQVNTISVTNGGYEDE